MKTVRIDHDEWMEALEEARAMNSDKVPDGWRSMPELQEKFGLGEAQTRRLLKQLVASGRAQQKTFRVAGPSGRLRVNVFYRLSK